MTIRELNISLDGRTVLENISFRVTAGQAVGIIGPNGAGKTTLLKAILGLIRFKGEIRLMGHPNPYPPAIREQIGYLPQHSLFERYFPFYSADVVATGLLSSTRLLQPFTSVQRSQVMEALSAVGMEHTAGSPFSDLSGGEQQRVLLARALVCKPRLLFLDEPGTGLDFTAQISFFRLLQQLQQEKGLTVVLVSHDLVAVAGFAQTLICVNRIMHIHGNPQEVLQSHQLADAYRCQYDFLYSALKKEGQSID